MALFGRSSGRSKTLVASPTMVEWDEKALVRNLDQLLDVYSAAMDYDREVMQWRRGYIASHAGRPGFRALATWCDDRLAGFCYGYLGRAGQWWHDQVRSHLDHEAYEYWLTDSFEIVELHVHPDLQGRGIGARQLESIAAGVSARTVVLSTPELPDGADLSRAWRLYRRYGFLDVTRHMRFPGDERPFAVLGRDLPLRPSSPDSAEG